MSSSPWLLASDPYTNAEQQLISMQSLEGRLLFAVPKKGRLHQASLNLLEGADIQFRRESRVDIALVRNLNIALLFLPAADIPIFIGEGRVDLGITGSDQVREYEASRPLHAENPDRPHGCDTVLELGFGSCRLQVQVPVNGVYTESSDLVGKTICTSFEHLARDHFARLEGNANPQSVPLRTAIMKLNGSVEAACSLGVADGIVDLVESGETMRAAGLKPIDTVLDTTAILIKSRHHPCSDSPLLELIASRISGVIIAQRYVLCQYNVAREKLGVATRVTPGKRAPTVTTTEDQGLVAVSAMVEKKNIANVMDELARIGATDILTLDIKNTRAT